jgi:predicted outer membrane repeat protein
MTDCTISDNTSEIGYGGGIYINSGTPNMTNCTVSGNSADWRGGGIYSSSGTLNMTNCTVSGNTADNGGGIFNLYETTLTNCTISGNTAREGNGGGIDNEDSLMMMCTIVYGNTASISSDNIDGGYDDAGDNIVDVPNPLLGPLQDNGGPTETHALLAGSPAIDGCTGGNCTVDTDQRGISRPQLIACDVGAYEYQQPPPVGGIVEPVDKLSLLAPWLVLVALMAVAITIAVVVRRRIA